MKPSSGGFDDGGSDDDEPYMYVDGREDGGARLNVGQDDLKTLNRGVVGLFLAILSAANPGKPMFEDDALGNLITELHVKNYYNFYRL